MQVKSWLGAKGGFKKAYKIKELHRRETTTKTIVKPIRESNGIKWVQEMVPVLLIHIVVFS